MRKSIFLLGALFLSCVSAYARCPNAACNAVADRCHAADKKYTKQILDASPYASGPEGNKAVAAADALVQLWESGDCAVMMQWAKTPGLAEQLAGEKKEAAVVRMSRAHGYLAKGDFDRAIQDYDQAIKLDPKFLDAFSNRGKAFASRKAQFDRADWSRAVQDFTQAIKLDPNHAESLNNRCEARAKLGLERDALADCNESLRIRPNNDDALKNRGFNYLKLGQIDRAIADYDAALKLNPKLAEALFGRGLTKQKKGDRAGGEADIIAAKAAQPDIAEAFVQYGVATVDGASAPVPTSTPTAVQKSSPTQAPATDCAQAETHWKSAEDIKTLAVYQDHLARFPTCNFAALARARIEALKK